MHTHPIPKYSSTRILSSAPSRLGAMLLTISILCSPARAQDLLPKAAPQSAPVMIYNAIIHPISGGEFRDGFVMFTDGKITGLGTVGEKFDIEKNRTDGWTMIDAAGRHVYPGLIAAYSQLGLTEFAAVRATLDAAEVGAATPEVRAAIAVNPDSTLIPVARSNGVLLAGVFPASGTLSPGRAGVIRLDGWTTEQMTINAQAGLVINWPNMRPITARWMNRTDREQRRTAESSIATIDQLFHDAAAYRDGRSATPAHPVDLRLDAMIPLLPQPGATGPASPSQSPVFIMAQDYDQVISSVAFADRHRVRIVIVGGMDAPLAADLLKARDIPVIVNGTYRFPKRADGDYDEPFSLPAKLHAAGVRFCISSGEEAANERNLPYAASCAVAFGLDHDAALRALTLSAAEILGADIASQYGSLEPGKSATLFIADGDILEITTHIDQAWIDGRTINLANKQTDLEKKYREKYRQLGEQPK